MYRYSEAAAAALPAFIDSSSVPVPKFQLFDVVMLHSESEEGAISDDLVQIVGLCWCPSGSRVIAWWYEIRALEKLNGINSHLSAGHQENCIENELVPIADMNR